MGATRKVDKDGLTPKERVFVNEFVKTGHARKSGEKAYPNQKKTSIRQYVAGKLKRPHIQKVITQALEDEGITDKYIAKKLKLTIDKGINEDQQIKPQEGIRALEAAVKLREYVNKELRGSVSLHLHQDLVVNDKQKLLDKRAEFNDFFSKIVEGEESEKPPQQPKKQAK